MTDFARTLCHVACGSGVGLDALEVMRLSLLDWCAVAVAGRDEPVARILCRQALEEGGREEAGLVAAQVKVPARMAALVNGATSHALDYDDTHFAHIGHPSVAVVPAALAAAELSGATGAALQEAALIGAEASIRVGIWLGRGHYQIGFHQTATAGAFGAALAAGRLLQLDEDRMLQAIGLVSTRASGLKSQFGTMGKPMNAGLAAANGIEAALLAAKGFVSTPDGLDGPQGFGATHHGESKTDAIDGFGRTWLFPSVQHKFHACCHGLHAMLEALSKLRVAAPDIESVEIASHPRWMTVCNIPAPATGLEAKFSFAMTAALALSGRDTARLDSFSDELCADPAIVALRNRVTVEADSDLEETQAKVRVTAKNGTCQIATFDLSETMEIGDRRRRVHEKAAILLGAEQAEHLGSLIDEAAAPEELIAALAPR